MLMSKRAALEGKVNETEPPIVNTLLSNYAKIE